MHTTRHLLLVIILSLLWTQSAQAQRNQYLWQTNSQGNDIHIFRVDGFELHRRLEVGPEPTGIAAPKDGRVVYVSLEANDRDRGELLWIDPLSLEIEHRLEVGPEPHAIATTPDGRWVYVPCRDGHYWVVDAAARKVVTKIRTGGRPHNTQASRDGRYMYLSPMYEPQGVTVVDIHAGHEVVGFIPFAASVRPSALSEDGRFLFQHVDGLNGFQVADTSQRRVVATVEHSTDLGWFMPVKRLGYVTLQGLKRCHGLAIRPDQTEIWSVCAKNLAVHSLVAPSFPEKTLIELEEKGYWLTFSPDGRHAFVALTGQNRIAVVDAARKRIVRHLSAGAAPKRNMVIELSQTTSNEDLRTDASLAAPEAER